MMGLSFCFGLLVGGFIIGVIFRREIKRIRRIFRKISREQYAEGWGLGYEDGYGLGYSDALRNKRENPNRGKKVRGL